MLFSNIFLPIALITAPCCADIQPTVAIIGAGLAGLTTAYRLQQKGIDVQIYEARNRVGGRIFTAHVGNTIAEFGAQNITDGGEAENIHRFINEFQLELTETQANLNHYYFDGSKFISSHILNQKKLIPESLKSQLDTAVQKAQNMRDILRDLFNDTDPFYKTLSVRLAAYEGASIEKLSPLYAETLYYMLLGGICSAHQDENYINLVSIKEGNAVLPEKLAQSLGKRVHLNMPLGAVSKTLSNSYELTFQNGQKIRTDILVLAIPCSVYGDIAFEQDIIPEDKLESIQSVRYGTNAKILVPFSQPLLSRTTLINDRIVSFFNNDCSILTLYYTGESASFSADTILKTYQQERPMLESGFGDLCPPVLPPLFAQDEAEIFYDQPVGYSWPNDPYAKGSYSYISPGQEDLLTSTHDVDGERVKTLFAPIDQTLYFAGEHASILMEVPGTMEAACESGERAARMIENSLNNSFFLKIIDKHSENREEVVSTILDIQKSLLIDLDVMNFPDLSRTGFLTIQMTPEYLNNFIAKNGTVILAVKQHQIIGYLLLGESQEFIDWASKQKCDSIKSLQQLFLGKNGKYIDQIALSTPFARQGIGTLLLNQAKELSPDGLLTDILLEPYPNTASLSFFSKNGFVNAGIIHIDATTSRQTHKTSVMLYRK